MDTKGRNMDTVSWTLAGSAHYLDRHFNNLVEFIYTKFMHFLAIETKHFANILVIVNF